MFNRIWLLSLFLICHAQAENISRPVFSRERVFVIQPNQSAEKIHTHNTIDAYVFQEALEECQLDRNETAYSLSRIFNLNESSILNSLKKIFLPLTDNHVKNLRVLVDNFGPAVRDFRSFYLKPQQGMPATISIDCKNSTKMMWPALMSHELVHHINSENNLSVWVDEMFAQLVEVENSFAFPYPRLQKLSESVVTASFFTSSPVFKSSEQYASNLLFGFYLRQLFGNSVFKNLNRDVKTLKDLSGRLIEFTSGKVEFDWLRDYLDPRSLIRHFNLALNINSPILNGGSIFMVPNWNGFSSQPVAQGKFQLEPGSSVRLSSSLISKLTHLPDALAAYRILKNGSQFKILKLDEVVQGSWGRDFIVLINLSQDHSFEIEL